MKNYLAANIIFWLLLSHSSYAQLKVVYAEDQDLAGVLASAGLPASEVAKLSAAQQTRYFTLESSSLGSSFSLCAACPENVNLDLTDNLVTSWATARDVTYAYPTGSPSAAHKVYERMRLDVWVIHTAQTSTIAGYDVIKATLKSHPSVVAWFTTQVPISFGPSKYGGLPGLIVRLEAGSSIYSLHTLEKTSLSSALALPSFTESARLSHADYGPYLRNHWDELLANQARFLNSGE